MPRIAGTATGSKLARVICLLALMAPFLLTSVAAHGASTFQVGDVFVGVGNGQIQWYHPDGTLVQTLNNGVGGFTTGMAFDSAGHLYGTNFSGGEKAGTPAHPNPPQGGGGSVSEYDTDGTLIGPFGSGYSTPEDLLFDKSGDAYVGNLGGFTLKLDGDGNQLQSFTNGRTDWLDLAADQCTLFFTDESGTIHRYDVCTDSPLSDFGSGGQYALRLLPQGGLVAASSSTVNRFDDQGNVIQTYDAPGEDCWFALNLDPDGTSLWSADFCTADFVKFDIATGNVLDTFNTGTGADTVFGLTVFGEITVGGGNQADLSITKTDSPDPLLVDNQLTYTLAVDNAGPDTATAVTVIDTLPSSVDFVSATPSTGTCTGTTTVTCSLGDMSAGASETITIVVTTTAAGTITNIANATSSTSDPSPNNNAATAETTVNAAPSGGPQTGAGGTAGSPLLPGLAALGMVVLAGLLRMVRTKKI